MLIGNAVVAYRMLYLFDRQISDHIRSEMQMIEKQLRNENQIQHVHFSIGDEIEITPINQFTMLLMQPTTKDTVIVVEEDYVKKNVKYRILTYEEQINEGGYR